MNQIPTKPGYYWAKWRIPAEGTVEGTEICPSDTWEIVQVNINHVDWERDPMEDEALSVSVPGVQRDQWRDCFVWGDFVAPLADGAKESFYGVPADLGRELWRRRSSGKCTTVKKACHTIPLSGNTTIGVVGDGENASYEWFIWRGRKLELSDMGYGDPHAALRDVLISELG